MQQSDDAARLARLEAYWLLGYGQRRAEMAGIDAMPDDGEENAYVRRGYEQLDPPPFIQHDPIQQKCLRDCLAKLRPDADALAAAEQRGYDRAVRAFLQAERTNDHPGLFGLLERERLRLYHTEAEHVFFLQRTWRDSETWYCACGAWERRTIVSSQEST